MIVQWYYIYNIGDGKGTKIYIDFLHVWRHWSDNVLLSLFASIPFPLAFLILYFREAKKNLLLIYSWSLFLVSLLAYACIAESGGKGYTEWDANFSWGPITCNFILYLVTASLCVKKIVKENIISKKDIILSLIFLLQFLTGLAYIFKMPFFGYR
jgi:hypothetical protein